MKQKLMEALDERDGVAVAEAINQLRFRGARVDEGRGLSAANLSDEKLQECLDVMLETTHAARERGTRETVVESLVDEVLTYLLREEDEPALVALPFDTSVEDGIRYAITIRVFLCAPRSLPR